MENTYKRIVIAVDGSEAADKAFEKSIELAKANDATLIITHVVDTRPYTRVAAYDTSSIIGKIKEGGKQLLAKYEQTAKEAEVVHTETILGHGSPKYFISKKVIPEVRADLIVMGATGLNAVERFMIGSVSERTVRVATCDVLIVK